MYVYICRCTHIYGSRPPGDSPPQAFLEGRIFQARKKDKPNNKEIMKTKKAVPVHGQIGEAKRKQMKKEETKGK